MAGAQANTPGRAPFVTPACTHAGVGTVQAQCTRSSNGMAAGSAADDAHMELGRPPQSQALDHVSEVRLHLGRAAGPQCRMDRLALGRAVTDTTSEGPFMRTRSSVSLLSMLGRLALLGSPAQHSCRLVLMHGSPRTQPWS